MDNLQSHAKFWGVVFVLFAIGAMALDVVGVLSGEHPVSVRIAEIGPFVFGVGLYVFSLIRRNA